MRLTAYSIILFFVCLNVSLYLVNELQVIPFGLEPYESPGDITTRLVGGFAILTVGALIEVIAQNWLFGAAALVLFALDYLLPIFHWIFFGFPEFVTMVAAASGNAALIYTVTGALNALMAVVWFWFFMGFLTARYMEQ